MALTSVLDKLATYLIIALFLLGVWEATNMIQTDTPWYKDVYAQSVDGDFTKIFDLAKMSIGWAIITPTIHVNQMPWYLQWYGMYYSLIMPSGFIPIPSVEIFIFISLTLLIVILPLALITKRWVKKRATASTSTACSLTGRASRLAGMPVCRSQRAASDLKS